jgi:hypothetical protein
MDDSFIGINAFFVLNYTPPVMAFKPGSGSPYAGRRRVAAPAGGIWRLCRAFIPHGEEAFAPVYPVPYVGNTYYPNCGSIWRLCGTLIPYGEKAFTPGISCLKALPPFPGQDKRWFILLV